MTIHAKNISIKINKVPIVSEPTDKIDNVYVKLWVLLELQCNVPSLPACNNIFTVFLLFRNVLSSKPHIIATTLSLLLTPIVKHALFIYQNNLFWKYGTICVCESMRKWKHIHFFRYKTLGKYDNLHKWINTKFFLVLNNI